MSGCCQRPTEAQIMPVVYTMHTEAGPVEYDQGRRIVFTYPDGTYGWLADAVIHSHGDSVEIPHVRCN